MFLCLIKFSVAHLFFILIFKSISFSDTVVSLLQWLHSGSQQKWKWAPNTSPAWNNFNCLSWRNCYLAFFFFFLKVLWSFVNLVLIVWIPLLWRFVPERKKKAGQAVEGYFFPTPCPARCCSPGSRARWQQQVAPEPLEFAFSRALFSAPAWVCAARSAHARGRALVPSVSSSEMG